MGSGKKINSNFSGVFLKDLLLRIYSIKTFLLRIYSIKAFLLRIYSSKDSPFFQGPGNAKFIPDLQIFLK